MFRRDHHNSIFKVLKALDGDLFKTAECFFGGGTAITLALDEYRESVDIDFLCASQEGYKTLRQAVWGKGFEALLKPDSEPEGVRDLKTDHYGIRTAIAIDNIKIKFEIVREARIPLHGKVHPEYGVPVLAPADMFAEKLLANADRWADPGVMNRDAVDLGMMVSRWGVIPDIAWSKAEGAYGETVHAALDKAIEKISDLDHLEKCLDAMQMDRLHATDILDAFGVTGYRPPSILD